MVNLVAKIIWESRIREEKRTNKPTLREARGSSSFTTKKCPIASSGFPNNISKYTLSDKFSTWTIVKWECKGLLFLLKKNCLKICYVWFVLIL